mgnify:CR=1 FL=1
MSGQAQPAIEVEDLTVAYTGQPVLWDLDTPADLARWRAQQRLRTSALTNRKHSA